MLVRSNIFFTVQQQFRYTVLACTEQHLRILPHSYSVVRISNSFKISRYKQMKTWLLSNDALQLSSGDMLLSVTAEQVFSSVVEETQIYDDLAVGKHGDTLNLNFIKYPVRVSIFVHDDSFSGLPCIDFLATTQRNTSFPISRLALHSGHVVFNGSWYPCDQESMITVMKLLDELSLIFNEDSLGKHSFTLNSLKDILLLKHSSFLGLPVTDNLSDRSIRKLLKNYSKSYAPRGVSANLYPYQQDGWNWLFFAMYEGLGVVLADEMGLGKTLQIICAISEIKYSFPDACFLVVCPGSILENWRRELSRFCPSLIVYKHHGSNRVGDPKVLTEYDVVITSYDTAARDLSMFKMVNWWAIILDEAQNIRNPTTRRAKSIKQISRRVGIAVSGTPLENRLRDIWSIFDFIAPNYLGELRHFENRFAENEIAARELEPLVSPVILRRMVAEVANDLPDRLDIPEVLEFTQDEAAEYENIRVSTLHQYGQSASLVSITKLRQFCSHPSIIDMQNSDRYKNFTKFQRLRELIEEIASLGEKALVFTSYTKLADMIASMVVTEFDSMASVVDGRIDFDRRQTIIDEFSCESNFLLLALNPRAAGTGLNISAANHVIHYNPEWNPALVDQATARAYRRGQERPVTVRRLIFCGTVEETMEERLSKKRALADGAIVGVKGSEENYPDIFSALQQTPMKSR